MAVVFRKVDAKSNLYDLTIDGRAAEYDVEPEDFAAALKRRRVDPSRYAIYVEDETGYRTRLGRR